MKLIKTLLQVFIIYILVCGGLALLFMLWLFNGGLETTKDYLSSLPTQDQVTSQTTTETTYLYTETEAPDSTVSAPIPYDNDNDTIIKYPELITPNKYGGYLVHFYNDTDFIELPTLDAANAFAEWFVSGQCQNGAGYTMQELYNIYVGA